MTPRFTMRRIHPPGRPEGPFASAAERKAFATREWKRRKKRKGVRNAKLGV
jgi:hypothetical protein